MDIQHSTIIILVVLLGISSCKNNEEQQGRAPLPSASNTQASQNIPTTTTSASIRSYETGTGMERYATKDARAPVAFHVAADKLERIINDTKLRLSFGIPRGFQPRAYATLPADDIARKFTDFVADSIRSQPVYTFGDERNSLVVSLLTVQKAMSYKEFLDAYELLNRARFAPAMLTVTSFRNKDIPMTQFFIQESEQGLFRIILPGTHAASYIQFDYTVRRVSIREDMERIEPSLGSITRLTANLP